MDLIPEMWGDLPEPYIPTADHDAREQAERTARSYQEIMEAKQGCRMPISYRASAGPSLFPVYDDYGLSEVYEIFYDSAINVANKYPKSAFAQEFYKTHKDNASRVKAQVPLLRHANRRWCTFATMNGASLAGLGSEIKPDNANIWSNQKQLLKQWEHTLPYDVPYTIMKGYTTTRKSPDKASFGVLYHLRELIPYFDTLLSQRAAYIRMFAWPTPMLKKLNVSLAQAVAEASGGKRDDFVWNETELIQLHPGEDLTFLTLQGGGEELEAQLATVLRLIDRAGLSAVTAGMSSADATSGYALSTLIQASQTKLAIYEKHLQSGHVRDVQMLLKYIIANNLTMYVHDKSKTDGKWLSLSADDLGGKLPEMRSRVKADIKQDMQMLLQTAAIAKQEGFWSLTTGQDYIGVEDPVKEQKRTLIDQTMTSQEIRSLISNKIIERTTSALDKEADKSPTPAMAAGATPAQQAAIATLSGQGAGLPPEVVAGLPGGSIDPTNPQAVLDQAGLPPVAGAPNTNVPPPGVNRAPNPSPPNAGGATGLPGPAQQPRNRSRRKGGRTAGANRNPGGPRYGS